MVGRKERVGEKKAFGDVGNQVLVGGSVEVVINQDRL